jgi:membrane protein implicated in regulation of membrane protease activity
MDLILTHLTLTWAVLAAILIVIEVAVPHFGCLFPGIAALAALLASFQLSVTVQLLVFTVTLVLGIFLLRPWLLKRTHSSPGVASRTSHLIGKTGVVTLSALPGAMGRVTVEAQDWAVRSTDKLQLGDEVEVKTVDGIVLIVKK